MYESRPRARDGEDIEKVLPSALRTTSSTDHGPAPLRPIRSALEASRGSRGTLIRAIAVLVLFNVVQALVLVLAVAGVIPV